MAVHVDTDWQYNGIPAVILENECIRIVIMPELGAKIWRLLYKPKGKEMLWQHPRLKPRKLSTSVYDDVFFGGWDELFPNDIPEILVGEAVPDHGELWTLPWEYRIVHETAEEVCIHLWVETSVFAVRVDKWITLKAGQSMLHFRHSIHNKGVISMPYLWKLHVALVVDENSRIDLPARTVQIEDFGPTRLGRVGVSYTWPYAEDETGIMQDMRRTLPITAAKNEFQYATEMDAGWCALTQVQEQIGFGLSYDLDVLPSCWLFATYGGWRGLNTVVLEPCSGYPVSVNDGINQGTHRILEAGEQVTCSVTAVIYEGLTAVTAIDRDGTVHGQKGGNNDAIS
jgi:hypothetical protein